MPTRAQAGAGERGARRIGLGSAAALVVANMIGAGVFTTSGLALADVGDRRLVLAAWAIGGLVALCGALSYGALARRFPESGGEYALLTRTVHPLAGFLAGWVSLLAGFTAPIAAAALGLQAYLGAVAGGGTTRAGLATGAILVAGVLHGMRFRVGVAAQNAAVAVKLVLLLGFIALGLRHLAASTPGAGEPGGAHLGAFAVTLVWVSFAYSGWNAAIYVAGEVRDPDRVLARALVLATLVVTAVYLALNAIFLYAAPPGVLAGKVEIGAVAAEAIGGPALRAWVALLVALALFTSISSMVMAGARVFARMAQDGYLPGALGAQGDTPGAAVALQVGLAVAVVWASGLASLLSYVGFTLGISAAATVAGLVALRLREGPEGVAVPGWPLVPVSFIAVTLVTAFFLALRQPLQAALGLLTVAAGLPLYWRRTPLPAHGVGTGTGAGGPSTPPPRR